MRLTTKTKQINLTERTLVMGILNITPDSFSDGGAYNSIHKAVSRAKQLADEGADIIDIGGESTRPNHEPISAVEEIARVVPIIRAVKEQVDLPISIDTYKAETARQALEAGADMINDIWGAKRDKEMAHVAAAYHVPIILMHNRDNKKYNHLIADIIHDLEESIAIVKGAGVKDEHIIIDPGIGFGKTLEDNFTVLHHLEQITEQLGYPLLLATSRKSFITKVLDLPAAERDNATGATTCLGIQKGARIIRVHDVKRHVELARMTDAILRGVN